MRMIPEPSPAIGCLPRPALHVNQSRLSGIQNNIPNKGTRMQDFHADDFALLVELGGNVRGQLNSGGFLTFGDQEVHDVLFWEVR